MRPLSAASAPGLRSGGWTVLCLVLALLHGAPGSGQEAFDLVLSGGRVIDPESGLDAVRNVGIRGGTIVAISPSPLEGDTEVTVSGLVVAPGFIDLHAHGQGEVESSFQVRDGVTTALELEGGEYPVEAYYERRSGKAYTHYGATTSHSGARRFLMKDRVDSSAMRYEAMTADELDRLDRALQEQLDDGALGIGWGIHYVPGARREEVYRGFQVAARNGVTNFVHVRYAGLSEPGSSIEAIHEMIANSVAAGASTHVVHIGSSGLGQVPIILEMIEGAQSRGVDITTEVYPYTAASTDIRAAIFDEGWRERFASDYDDIEWVLTGERLDEESFHRLREEGGIIIAHIIPAEMVDHAVSHPLVMIASDGVPFVGGRAHPRGQGTFARVLGRYVRERGLLTLVEALRKMTLMPARRLEAVAPEMARKGRLRVGADADVTVFDAERVVDRATFAEPALASAGIVHVLVGGTFAVRDEQLVEGSFPGRPVRRPVAP